MPTGELAEVVSQMPAHNVAYKVAACRKCSACSLKGIRQGKCCQIGLIKARGEIFVHRAKHSNHFKQVRIILRTHARRRVWGKDCTPFLWSEWRPSAQAAREISRDDKVPDIPSCGLEAGARIERDLLGLEPADQMIVLSKEVSELTLRVLHLLCEGQELRIAREPP